MCVVIRLELPPPISANDYWGTRVIKVQGRWTPTVYVTHEASDYRKCVAEIAQACGVKPIEGRVSVHVQVYPHRPLDYERRQRKLGAAWEDGNGRDVPALKCQDLDNSNKVLLDALKGIAFGDDRWVWRLSSERMEPDGDRARVVVTVERIQVAQPQLALLGEVA